MDKKLASYIDILMETRHGKKEGDVDAFEDVIWDIYDRNDPRDIVYLCNAFDDNTPYAEMTGPLQTLAGAIEEYFENYTFLEVIPPFVEGICQMLPHAQDWATGMLYRHVMKREKLVKEVTEYCKDYPNERHILIYLADKAHSIYMEEEHVNKFKTLLLHYS